MAKRDKDSCSNVPHGCQSAFDRRQKILAMTPTVSAVYLRDQASSRNDYLTTISERYWHTPIKNNYALRYHSARS